jgi:hypothetical protein
LQLSTIDCERLFQSHVLAKLASHKFADLGPVRRLDANAKDHPLQALLVQRVMTAGVLKCAHLSFIRPYARFGRVETDQALSHVGEQFDPRQVVYILHGFELGKAVSIKIRVDSEACAEVSIGIVSPEQFVVVI